MVFFPVSILKLSINSSSISVNHTDDVLENISENSLPIYSDVNIYLIRKYLVKKKVKVLINIESNNFKQDEFQFLFIRTSNFRGFFLK